MPFFADLNTMVMGAFGTLTNASAAMTNIALPLVGAGFTLQIMWQGFEIIRGQGGSNHLLDLFSKTVKISIVIFLGLTATSYQQYIVDVFSIDGPASLTMTLVNVFFPGAATTPVEALDRAWEAGINAFSALQRWALSNIGIQLTIFPPSVGLNTTGLTVLILACVLVVMIMLLCVASFADLITNQLGILICLGVGPAFIACYAFEGTKRFFESWLSAVLKLVFSSFAVTIVVLMAAQIIGDFATRIITKYPPGFPLISIQLTPVSNLEILRDCAEVIVAAIALFLLSAKANYLAGDLVGSFSVPTKSQNVGAAIGKGIQTAANAAGGQAMRAAGMASGAGSAMRKGSGSSGSAGPGTSAVQSAAQNTILAASGRS